MINEQIISLILDRYDGMFAEHTAFLKIQKKNIHGLIY